MEGYIDAQSNCPMIELEVNFRRIRCLIDTGFNGYLAIGSDVAEVIRLRHGMQIHKAKLGDGSESPFRLASCNVLWFGIYRHIEVSVFMLPRTGNSDAIIGTRLLTPYVLVADFNHGTVKIKNPALFTALP